MREIGKPRAPTAMSHKLGIVAEDIVDNMRESGEYVDVVMRITPHSVAYIAYDSALYVVPNADKNAVFFARPNGRPPPHGWRSEAVTASYSIPIVKEVDTRFYTAVFMDAHANVLKIIEHQKLPKIEYGAKYSHADTAALAHMDDGGPPDAYVVVVFFGNRPVTMKFLTR